MTHLSAIRPHQLRTSIASQEKEKKIGSMMNRVWLFIVKLSSNVRGEIEKIQQSEDYGACPDFRNVLEERLKRQKK